MIELTREVRFTLSAADFTVGDLPVGNSWSGSGASTTLAPFICLQCTVAGELEMKSSYVCNIKLIDQFVREKIVPVLRQQISEFQQPEAIIKLAKAEITREFPKHLQLVRLVCKTSPFVHFAWEKKAPDMISFTEQFEFSAAHRLHNPDLTDEENQSLFGKCNRPSGHGHNYLVNVTVSKPITENEPFDARSLRHTVKSKVIDRLDHKHLNQDIDVFQTLNPTVENIAKTIFNWLGEELKPTTLHSIRVYETPKTWAEVFSA